MKRILSIAALLGLILSVQAQAVELREDHPREYIVQQGDTLWEIAGRFLERPWQWPAIWQANPEIDDPHLIFPGDRISLEFVGGEPRLAVERDAEPVEDGVRRLSPGVRRESVDGPIHTIPYDAIEPFLRHPRIVEAGTLDDLPYIIANFEQRVFAGPGDRTYVRGMEDARVGDEVVIARMAYEFEDRSAQSERDLEVRQNRLRVGKGRVPSYERPAGRVWQATLGRMERFDYPILGYEMWETARARVIQVGDPTILELTEGRREVMEGDVILPIDDRVQDVHFHPRAMDEIPDGGRVLTVSQAYYGVGHYQIVAISLGTDHGIEPGHTFSTFRPGETIRDNQRYPLMSRAAFDEPDRRFVELPDEYTAEIMVFRPFDRISYAIVLDGTNVVRSDDLLRHPDDRL